MLISTTPRSILVRASWLAGLVAGTFIVMNLVVVPLSAFAPRPVHVSLTWIGFNILAMLLFGTIIALLARLEFGRSKPARVESPA
jgi:hypothetical protein